MGNTNVKEVQVVPRDHSEVIKEQLASDRRVEMLLQSLVNLEQIEIVMMIILVIIIVLTILRHFIKNSAAEALRTTATTA